MSLVHLQQANRISIVREHGAAYRVEVDYSRESLRFAARTYNEVELALRHLELSAHVRRLVASCPVCRLISPRQIQDSEIHKPKRNAPLGKVK